MSVTRGTLAGAIMDVVDDVSYGALEAILSYYSWWDCPRSGVATVDGQPYYFDCPFSEELDDYPDRYRLWPLSDDELADQLEVWQMFASWRDQFDSGLHPPAFPGELRSGALERVKQRSQRRRPPDARVAIPEWRLDPDRSFAGRVPVHKVRWTFVGDTRLRMAAPMRVEPAQSSGCWQQIGSSSPLPGWSAGT
jgi:hypothetical protein